MPKGTLTRNIALNGTVCFEFLHFLYVAIHTVKLHKHGPILQTADQHPFPQLLGQPSSALLSTAAQAGGPPSVQIGWTTAKLLLLRMLEAIK